ncbi:unnamed protein product, partial [Effrenium voratum]
MALVDSKAAFSQRCDEVDPSGALKQALDREGLSTFSQMAFAAGTPNNPVSDEAFEVLAQTVFGDGATLGQTANLKRLQFEACTIVIADVKAKVSVSGSAEPARLPAAEKAARLADQKKRLLGVPIQGNLEPAHSLLDLVAAMAETNVVVYIAPEKCGVRMDEIAQITKPQKAVIAVESSSLKVNTPDTHTDADLGSELKLQWALQRRGLAFDQCSLVSWEVHESWLQQLLGVLTRTVPTGYAPVRVAQLMTADRELWIAIAEEHLPSLRPQADGKWPLDKAIQDLRYNPRITMHLLPLPSAVAKVATAPPPKEASGGKVATRPRCPELLIGCELKTKDGKPVCYGFNLESGWEEADLSAQWDHGLIWRQSQWTIRSNELKDRPDGLDGLRGALDPKDMLSQLQAHEQNSSNRILLGGMPRGRKLRPFVSEFGQYLTVLGPVQDVDSLKHFLQLKPKGSKITRRQICTWGEARVCAQQFQWAILPPMPTAEAGLVEKAVVGIPRSPEEFVKAAVAAGHPRDIAVFLQKETKAAVIANRDLTAVDIIRRRIEFIKHWLGRRSALEEEEKKLHAAMPEYVRVVLKGKNILLMGEMLRDLGYPDVMLQQHVAEGFKLTGWLPETGYFQKRVRRPELRVEQALQMAKGVNHGILKQMRAEELTDLDRATWEETCKEVEKGWIFEDVAPNLHGVLLAKRFGLQQKEKVRVIDDYTVGGLNKTCGLKEKLRVQAVDEMAAMIAYSLDTCEASTHPRVLGRTYDLEAAYKQYAVHPADRAISRLVAKDTESGKLRFFGSNALPFGAVGSVAGFLRVSSGLAYAGLAGLQLLWSSFFDDYTLLSREDVCKSAGYAAEALFTLWGVRFARTGKKCVDFADTFKTLGLMVGLENLGSGICRIFHTPDRREELADEIEDILQKGQLTAKEAERLRGRMVWFESFVWGRLANYALKQIRMAFEGSKSKVEIGQNLARHFKDLRER